MNWADRARGAWEQHQEEQRAGLERDTEQLRAFLVKRARLIGIVDHGDQVETATITHVLGSEDTWAVAYGAPTDIRGPGGEVRVGTALGCPIGAEPALARLLIHPPSVREWVHLGPVETLADAGRLLTEPGAEELPPGVADQREESVGDMLYSVLQGLVREVVHEELDGRLGDARRSP